MTRRLIVAPLVCGPIAAAGALLWLKGLAWPIANQLYSLFAPRPETAETELDVAG